MAWKAFFRTWGSRAGRGEPTPAPPSALRAHLALGCAMGTACRGRGDLGPADVIINEVIFSVSFGGFVGTV